MDQTAVQWLSRPYQIAKVIRRKRETIEELRNSLLPAGIRYDRDRVQTSPEDPILRVESRIDELEREVESLIAERAQSIADVSYAIESLDDERTKQVAHCRYVKQMQIRAIASTLYMDDATVYRHLKSTKKQVNEMLRGRARF